MKPCGRTVYVADIPLQAGLRDTAIPQDHRIAPQADSRSTNHNLIASTCYRSTGVITEEDGVVGGLVGSGAVGEIATCDIPYRGVLIPCRVGVEGVQPYRGVVIPRCV